MDTLSTDTIVKPRYALSYGLRLDKGQASEFTHARVPIRLATCDGGVLVSSSRTLGEGFL